MSIKCKHCGAAFRGSSHYCDRLGREINHDDQDSSDDIIDTIITGVIINELLDNSITNSDTSDNSTPDTPSTDFGGGDFGGGGGGSDW